MGYSIEKIMNILTLYPKEYEQLINKLKLLYDELCLFLYSKKTNILFNIIIKMFEWNNKKIFLQF